ncbi:MAG: WD-40 repeat-containing [Planctomycetota bacterium]|nr:MAG: WD-40 repeat-containing [Planctomycetota bacterium]
MFQVPQGKVPGRWKAGAIGFAVFFAMALVVALLPRRDGVPPERPAAAREPVHDPPRGTTRTRTRVFDPRAPERGAARDLYGDPLPPRAIARLGSARLRHGNPVTALAFSRNGRIVVAADMWSTITAWEMATGRELWRAHDGWRVESLTPLPDGKTILVTEWFEGVHELRDIETGKIKRRLLAGFDRPHRSSALHPVAASPDGKWIATCGAAGSVLLWPGEGTAAPKNLGSENGGEGPALLGFAEAGKRLVAVWKDGEVFAWSVPLGERVGHVALAARKKSQRPFLAMSADGEFVVASGSEAAEWSTTTGLIVRALAPPGTGRVAISPGRLRAAILDSDKVRVWDLSKLAPAKNVELPAGATAVAFSPAASLAIGFTSGIVRFYDPETGREIGFSMGHGDAIRSVAFSDDGASVMTASDDGTVRGWEARTGRERWLSGGRGPVQLAAPVEGGRVLVVARGLSLVDAGMKANEKSERLDGPDRLRLAVLSADRRRLALLETPEGMANGEIGVWDVAELRRVAKLGLPREGLYSFALSPDGASLAATFSENECLVWDVASATRVGRVGLDRDLRYTATAEYERDGTLSLLGGMEELERTLEGSPPAHMVPAGRAIPGQRHWSPDGARRVSVG